MISFLLFQIGCSAPPAGQCDDTDYFDFASTMFDAGYSNCAHIKDGASFYEIAGIDDLIRKRSKQTVQFRQVQKKFFGSGKWPLVKYELSQPMGNYELWLLFPKKAGPYPVILLSHGHSALAGIDVLEKIDSWERLLEAGFALAIPTLPAMIGFVYNPPNDKFSSVYDNNT